MRWFILILLCLGLQAQPRILVAVRTTATGQNDPNCFLDAPKLEALLAKKIEKLGFKAIKLHQIVQEDLLENHLPEWTLSLDGQVDQDQSHDSSTITSIWATLSLSDGQKAVPLTSIRMSNPESPWERIFNSSIQKPVQKVCLESLNNLDRIMGERVLGVLQKVGDGFEVNEKATTLTKIAIYRIRPGFLDPGDGTRVARPAIWIGNGLMEGSQITFEEKPLLPLQAGDQVRYQGEFQ